MSLRVIYKYPLNMGETIVNLPITANFLSVKDQGDRVVAYFSDSADTVTDAPLVEHVFATTVTGQPYEFSSRMKFVDTIMLLEGSYVVHVFKS